MHPWSRSCSRRATRVRRAPAGAGILAIPLLLAGCGLVPEREPVDPSPPEDPAPQPPPPAPTPDVLAVAPRDTPPELYFVEARGHFLAGHHEEAERAYRAYLEATPGADSILSDGGDDPRQFESALWDLALLHLLPDSPLRDREAAGELLNRLEEEHGETVYGVQASWLLETLSALEEVQAEAARRAQDVQELQESIDELEEMVEELRRLHLERRPRLPPADTVDAADTLSAAEDR